MTTQDGWVVVERSDKMWSAGEGNGKPLQYSYLEKSLAVQWLKLHAPNAGGPGSIPGQGTRSHMLQLRPGTVE